MNATTTTLGAGTAVLSVDAIAAALHWFALHYQVMPEPDEAQLKAFAIILLVTVGSVIGGIWYVITAIVRRWMRDHNLDNGPVQVMKNP